MEWGGNAFDVGEAIGNKVCGICLLEGSRHDIFSYGSEVEATRDYGQVRVGWIRMGNGVELSLRTREVLFEGFLESVNAFGGLVYLMGCGEDGTVERLLWGRGVRH